VGKREREKENLIERIETGKLEALGGDVERLLVRLRHDGNAIGSNLHTTKTHHH
jgi:hypothetical protein